MEYLLTPQNIKVLESFTAVKTLYGFDYDGTLAPIADIPDKACMSKRTQDLLKKLNSLVPIAIISGRSVADVRSFLDFEPKYIIGNHGVEGIQNEQDLLEIAESCKHFKTYIEKFYSEQMSQLGIVLEDKKYSLTLHYRNSNEISKAENFLSFHLSNLPGATLLPGKMVINILPAKSLTKGKAFLSILARESTSFGFYVGDDETDETVFNYDDPKQMKVRIGHSATSRARYYLKNQSEIEKLLEVLVDFNTRESLMS